MKEPDQVSKDEYHEWKGNRVTRRFLFDLFQKREALKEGLVELHQTSEQERLVFIGRAQQLRDVIDWALIEFDYIGKFDNVETDRT